MREQSSHAYVKISISNLHIFLIYDLADTGTLRAARVSVLVKSRVACL